MSDFDKVRFLFEGRLLTRQLDIGGTSALVQLSVTLPSNYRSEMQVFVTLDPDLGLDGPPVVAKNSQYSVSPEGKFTGNPEGAAIFVPTFIEDPKQESPALFVRIPEVIPNEGEDISNDAVLTWEIKLKGTLSKTFGGHSIKAWLVDAGGAVKGTDPITFQLLPPAPGLGSGNFKLAGESNVYLEKAPTLPVAAGGGSEAPVADFYWVREPGDVELTGTLNARAEILYVAVREKDTPWKPARSAGLKVDGLNFSVAGALADLAFADDIEKEVHVRFSQTENPDKNTNPHGWSASFPFRVKKHTAKPTVQGVMVNNEFQISLVVETAAGPGIRTVEYKVPKIEDKWFPVILKEGLFTKAFPTLEEDLKKELGDKFEAFKGWDFSGGIKVRATDKIGNAQEDNVIFSSTMLYIASGILNKKYNKERGYYDGIRYNEPTKLHISVGAAAPAVLLPLADISIITPPEWYVENVVSLDASSSELRDLREMSIKMVDATKVGQDIPRLRARLSGVGYSKDTRWIEIDEGGGKRDWKYLPERPTFKLDPVQPVFHSGKIIISGTFDAPPLKSSPLEFFYSVDGNEYKSLKYTHPEGDAHFSILLPDTDFPPHKKISTVTLKIGHKDDTSADRYVVSDPFAVTVDNDVPAISNVLLSVTEGGGHLLTLHANATVQSPKSTSNPPIAAGISWTDGFAGDPEWFSDVAHFQTTVDQVKVALSSPRTAIETGKLLPLLSVKTKSGASYSHPGVFPNAYGLLELSGTLNDSAASIQWLSSLRTFRVISPADVSLAAVQKADSVLNFKPTLLLKAGIAKLNVSAECVVLPGGDGGGNRVSLSLQDGKKAAVTSTVLSDAAKTRVGNWTGSGQILTLRDAASNPGASFALDFPLRVPKGAPAGNYVFRMTFVDADSPRTAFSTDTMCELVVKVVK